MKKFFAWLAIIFFSFAQGADSYKTFVDDVGGFWAVVLAIVSAFGFYFIMEWAFDNRRG